MKNDLSEALQRSPNPPRHQRWSCHAHLRTNVRTTSPYRCHKTQTGPDHHLTFFNVTSAHLYRLIRLAFAFANLCTAFAGVRRSWSTVAAQLQQSPSMELQVDQVGETPIGSLPRLREPHDTADHAGVHPCRPFSIMCITRRCAQQQMRARGETGVRRREAAPAPVFRA